MGPSRNQDMVATVEDQRLGDYDSQRSVNLGSSKYGQRKKREPNLIHWRWEIPGRFRAGALRWKRFAFRTLTGFEGAELFSCVGARCCWTGASYAYFLSVPLSGMGGLADGRYHAHAPSDS